MKTLYRFYWDCGRAGVLNGLFIAEPEDVEKMYGKEVYFGEVLGKHSEICGTMSRDDITVLSTDQEKIEWLLTLFPSGNINGFNPLAYFDSEEYEDDEDEC